MAQRMGLVFVFISSWCFGQPDFSKVPRSVDSTYGYTAANPLELKKGNVEKSIGYAYDFLNGLVTLDGNSLKFVRRSTVANPQARNSQTHDRSSAAVKEPLDKYVFVTWQKDTIILYVDIFNRGRLQIPVGLKVE